MTKDLGNVLLVGSIARPEDGWSVEDCFRLSAETLGGYVTMLPDGEVGDRSQWITFIARHAYYSSPDLVTLSRHTYNDWKPKTGYGDQWRFGVREGVERVRLAKIGYADEAKRSYEVFRHLRDENVIPADVRFQVAYPLTESAVRAFVGNARDYEMLWRAYNEAVTRELDDLAATIPHQDLAIQWDLARETAAVEGVEFQFPNSDLTQVPADPMERYCQALAELSPGIPDDIWLGLHVCYGSLEHKDGESPDTAHYVPIADLSVAVEMLNKGIQACGRSVQFVHMPVQFSAGPSDPFYAPLKHLDVGDSRVYIGVVDPIDGVEGALSRIDVVRRYLPSFGLGTACGWGRRPVSQKVQDLLDLERDVADAATATGIIA